MSSSTADLPSLTPNQINALVVLMVEARKLTNAELQELAGFTLTGKDNKKLVELGLVETDRSRRLLSHELTDEGWRVVRELHTAAPPKAGRSASRSLFTLLTNLHRGLDRLRISHGDFFKQTGAEPAPEVAPTSPTEVAPTPARSSVGGDTEALVRAAYRELAARPGAWVGLADLRDHLGGADRAAVDTALRALVRQDGVRIIPVANSKSLTARDRAAAVRIGDEDNHMLAIGAA
ncbi:hypothetical protein C5N14_25190 [Micromonospora sp. MW-13]|uniref:hypothetical protein n=1 Tax=Micromonospora sp. MW-13 TaxID=2094022 RepID=UPI000E432EF0|nr:hypothetical protein [Micromonospora sp. MW-13]RGC66134.1 hypothetical protein C5N14_25190 [Micromonospora sp. MW-13]